MENLNAGGSYRRDNHVLLGGEIMLVIYSAKPLYFLASNCFILMFGLIL